MSERPIGLESVLDAVRRRWTQQRRLRAWTSAATALTLVVAAGWSAALALAPHGVSLLAVAALVISLAALVTAVALWSLPRAPTDRQIARLIEERHDGLDEALVTAVDGGAGTELSPRMLDALRSDAERLLTAHGLHRNIDAVIAPPSLRLRAGALLATALLLLAVGAFAPWLSRAGNVAFAYLFPAQISIEVVPGTARMRSGAPMTVLARINGFSGEVVPVLTVTVDKISREVRMTPTAAASDTAGATFEARLDNVTAEFAYAVTAANTRSDVYRVSLMHPPRVEQIDVRYTYPPDLRLEPRTDEDSGDIYGPAGTKVTLTVVADKPIAEGRLRLDDGSEVLLTRTKAAHLLQGELLIQEEGSYRVALADQEGLDGAGDTEYFIRTLEDRPPDVRIVQPASDRKVTPLEEVKIAAEADDDFGVAALDLVLQLPNGSERIVPLQRRAQGANAATTAAGAHTLFIEDLKVQPGDFVTYYAKARDVTRGRRASEVSSDIFFLEVKPFEEEFVAAQSQQGGRAGNQDDSSLEALAQAQKEIVVATWNLDARTRRARGVPPPQDTKAIATAQGALRQRVQNLVAQALRSGERRRRPGQGPAPDEDPLGKAIDAMGRARHELDANRLSIALPHEREALTQILKAAVDNRRRQVTRSQQAGSGGGQNRAGADLSTLFDRELRRRQSTNYETPSSIEEREEKSEADPLDGIRELARRQDALSRQQAELARERAQMSADEAARRLERLTREQNELRQRAEQLAKQVDQERQPQSGQQSQGQQSQSQQASRTGAGQSVGQGSPGQDGSKPGSRAGSNGQPPGSELRAISEEMRHAASGLRRQNATQAAQSGARAAERLQELEQQMQATRPDERRRALGDLQAESRQLADAERRLGDEAGRTAAGNTGENARRRLAGEQERLAQRVDRLQEQVTRLAKSGPARGSRPGPQSASGGASGGSASGNDTSATAAAARELEQQKIGDRMRASASALRQGSGAEDTRELARALDRVAERLGAGAGQDAETRRFSDQLGKAQELRDTLAEVDRSIERLQRAGKAANSVEGQPGARLPSSSGKGDTASSSGDPGGGDGGRALAQAQGEVAAGAREAQRLAQTLRREHPELPLPGEDAGWWPSVSAPGTEAFKQDFARWESLKQNLQVALEAVESNVSNELRAKAARERFNAGGHDRVSDDYRDLVDRYYRAIASPRPPR